MCYRSFYYSVRVYLGIILLGILVLVESLFYRQFAVFIILSQNSLLKLLFISIIFFIYMTIIYHFCPVNPFFLYMYGVAYFMAMPYFIQRSLSLTDINSLPSSVCKIFMKCLNSNSILESQAKKMSTNLFFSHKQRVHVFYVYLQRWIAAYILPN